MAIKSSKNPKKGLKELIKDLIGSHLRIQLSEYNEKIQEVIAIIIVIAVVFNGVKIYFKNKIEDEQILGDISEQTNITYQGDSSQTTNIQQGEGSQVFISNMDYQNKKIEFDSNKWHDSEGNLAIIRKEPNILILPLNDSSGLLKYSDPIPVDSIYEIKFIPLGDTAINFVVTIPEIYEIVIGDKDYRTISLKYSSEINQPPSIPVREKTTGLDRPKLTYPVNKNSEIGINIEQKLMSNGNLWVQFDIHYWAEDKKQKLPQSFTYEFKPSPRIDDSLFLNLGLIRGVLRDTISIKLIEPSLN